MLNLILVAIGFITLFIGYFNDDINTILLGGFYSLIFILIEINININNLK